MKVRVVRNSKGLVVAAYEAPSKDAVPVEIELERGERLDEVDMPSGSLQQGAEKFFEECARVLKGSRSRS